jgi:hypothetical protein
MDNGQQADANFNMWQLLAVHAAQYSPITEYASAMDIATEGVGVLRHYVLPFDPPLPAEVCSVQSIPYHSYMLHYFERTRRNSSRIH